MRSKVALFVLLMGVQVAYAFDSVPMAEYHQRRVKLAAELHGGSAASRWRSTRSFARTRTSIT